MSRSIAKLQGYQLEDAILRDSHFSVDYKINENKININWLSHKDILEDTKVDVFVQVNDKSVSEVQYVDLTSELEGYNVSENGGEGIRLEEKVVMRVQGTPDTPIADAKGNVVYGRITEDEGDYTLTFYSNVGGVETAYTMPENMRVDLMFVLRTNLSIMPANAIINGGAGFVEGATDARAYLNLQQLMKDLYGSTGTLDNDGNANLVKSVVDQLVDFSSTDTSKGAKLVGVVSSDDYEGTTVQDVIDEIMSKIGGIEEGSVTEVENARTRTTATENGYFTQKSGEGAYSSIKDRFDDVEAIADAEFKDFEDRLTELESPNGRYAFKTTEQITQVSLPDGAKAKIDSLFVSINGAIQAPTFNYVELLDNDGDIVGVDFSPGQVAIGAVIYLWWVNK